MGKLSAILWKNYLLKRAHLSGFLAELLLPVAFMALLILIKSITDKYDSPNVAYYCGNSFPWFYSESLQYINGFLSQVPLVCTQKPAQCESNHYYESGLSFSFSINNVSTSIQGYGQYGYIESAAVTSGISSAPFYTYTIGDTSTFYHSLQIANPSLPFCSVLSRVHRNHAIFAVAPETASSSTLVGQANSMRSYFLNQCDKAAMDNSTAVDYSSTIVYFDSQDDLESYITDKDYDDVGYGYGKVAFAVVLNSADVKSSSWDYSIRANYTSVFDQSDPTVACLYHSCDFTYTIPSTKYYTQDLLKPQSAQYLYGYTFSGFSTIQQIVDQYIFNQTLKFSSTSSSSTIEEVKIMASVSLMPTTAYQTDDFQYVISSTLGIFYMLSFLYPVSRIIRSLVLEKETRIREGMKMMGLSDTVYNLSWLITTFTQMTVVAILITLVTSSSVFEYSNKFFVFIYFEVFSLAVISMCFLLSSLFSKSKSASLLGPMIFFASFFPYYAVNDAQYSASAKTATCILAPACFALGANVFADYEGGLVGIQADNYTEESSNFSYSACVGMLFLDAVLYGLLAWYIDKVIPSEFGTQLPFYFPFLPSYWLGIREDESKTTPQSRYQALERFRSFRALFSSRQSYHSVHNDDEEVPVTLTNPLHVSDSAKQSAEADADAPASEFNVQDLQYMESNAYLEPIAAELRQQLTGDANIKCISIRNLRKEYGSSSTGGEKRIAVSGLNMDLFQGQVTVLLGHNGAGKSTTIGMLVGMIPPTSGTAIMPGGFSINEHMQAIRGNLGVCPQHDILFPELTALQHLQIYAVFKGVDSSLVNSEAQRMINEVGLKEKANAKSSTLSGGQKRKLSLGIALIGDSKVVILDEPTSGMDPYSRRSTWNIIQRNKKGRVILLTTHFMDEADLLGDRIAIMSNGKLQCMGSSMFLKNKFGVGYTLTIVKESQSKQQSDFLSSISQEIEKIVQKNIPAAEPLSNVGAEQSFRLPFSSSSKFADMFRDLDLNKAALGIAEYGISVTTLEEVFLRVDRHDYSSEATSTQGHELPSNTVLKFDSTPEPTQVLREKSRDVFLDTTDTDAYGLQGDEETAALTGKAVVVGDDDDDSNFVTFLKHFKALFQKRYIYGKRDKRMVFCQILLPFIVVVIGLSLLLIKPNTSQPNLVLSPVKYNPKMDDSLRNFVAFGVEENAQSSVGADMESLFTGQQGVGVYGVAVPIGDSLEGVSDSFGGCSEGANVLYNMSQFLMQSQPDSEQGSSRYGAITIAGNTNLSNLNYNVMVNGSAIHGVGIYVNQVHQAFLQVLANSSTASITARNYPLPSTFKEQTQTATVSAFIVALFCMIACCFIPASFVVFIVKEREVKAKHQQIISGVSIYSYWFSSYAWDIVSYLPTAVLIYLTMLAYQVKAYTEGSGAGATIALFLLFGPSSAAMTYLLSFLFVSHSTAQVVVMFFNFITGLCLMVTSFVLTTVPTTTEMNLTLRYFFRLFPAFCLGDGLIQLALCDGEICPSIDKTGYNLFVTESPLSWDTSGADITFMAIESVVYFLLALLIEYLLTFPSFLSFLYYVSDPPYSFDPEKEDEDVVTERNRVLSGQAANDVVRIEELRKVYPANSRTGGVSVYSIFNAILDSIRRLIYGSDATTVTRNPDDYKNTKVAVQSLCFGVPKGECFGFLGINGAGKTTTLSILSGEFPPSSGKAFIDGFNILESQSNIRKRIGYCPQFESLLDLLTVREHLELYARIKGVTTDHLEKIVMDKMDQLDLRDFENKVAGSLSGGNKRKLTVAVATIGGPSIVFLDEPSTGMDPMSRRFMWKVIAKMSTQDARCSVILTTHSMEEAEALCTRIGVMVNGRLCCIGSGQHLKHRFGNGYEVNIKTASVDLTQSQPLLLKLARVILNYEYGQITDGLRRNDSLTSLLNELSVQFSQSSGGAIAAVDADGLWERLALVLLSREDVRGLCNLLYYEADGAGEGKLQSVQEHGDGGMKNRFELICSGQSGALVEDILNADGCVSLRIFLEWFIAEEVSDSIHAYMQMEFPSKHKFLERSSLITFRFRIFPYEIGDGTGSGIVEASNTVLADVFSKFESSKEQLRIQEYSVGQTTLEQIFNQFAAGQDNPEVVA